MHYQQIISDTNTGEIDRQSHVKVNPKLANVIDQMVRYDFRQRYQSGEEALQAVKGLQNVTGLRPKSSSPPWTFTIFAPKWRLCPGI